MRNHEAKLAAYFRAAAVLDQHLELVERRDASVHPLQPEVAEELRRIARALHTAYAPAGSAANPILAKPEPVAEDLKPPAQLEIVTNGHHKNGASV